MTEKPKTPRASNPKKLMTWRVTAETERQLQELAIWLGSTKSEVLLVSVERLYQKYQSEQSRG